MLLWMFMLLDVQILTPSQYLAPLFTYPSSLLHSFSSTTHSYLIKITDTTKLGLTLPLSVLQKIPKLQDQEGYLKWKRTMRDHIKMFALSVSEPPGKTMTEKKEWTKATRSNLHSNQNL